MHTIMRIVRHHIATTIIPSLYLISELGLYNLNPIYPIIFLSCCTLGSLLLSIIPLPKSIILYTFIFILLPLYHPTSISYLAYGVVLVSTYTGIVLHVLPYKLLSYTKIKRYQY